MSAVPATDAATYLRDTSKLMRERADAATNGRWASIDDGDRLIAVRPDPCDDEYDDFDYVLPEPLDNEHDVAHIASWDPTVARAVADLLGFAAQAAEAHAAAISTSGLSLVAAALTVARTYRRDLP